MNLSHTLGVALALGSGLLAQGPAFTSPGALPGRTNNSLPFGTGTPLTHQQVHSASSFTAPGPALITDLSMDVSVSSTSASIDVELFMADAPHGADAISSVYANNVVPGTEVRVFSRRQVVLPPAGSAWSFAFPLDTPYSWNGGHLTWRADIYGNNQGNQSQRFALVCYRDAGSSSSRTNGCQSALGTARAGHWNQVPSLGGTLQCNGESHVAGVALPATLTMGLSNTQWGSLALPVDLGVIGAPGCLITNDIVAQVPTTTLADPTGSVSLSFTVPNTPAIAGQPFHTQYLFLQPGANALGIFTSGGVDNAIGKPPEISRVYGPIGGAPWTTQKQFGIAIGLN